MFGLSKKHPLSFCLLLWVFTGVGGVLIRLREPPVRVVQVGLDIVADPYADIKITITDDDGTSALPDGTVVSLTLVAEFDAALVFQRTYGPDMTEQVNTIPTSVTTTTDMVDYTVQGFRIDADADFVENSFKIVMSLDVPGTTLVGRSSFELWIHNIEAIPLGFLIMNPANVLPNSKKDVYLYAISRATGMINDGLSEDIVLLPPTVSKNGSGLLPGRKLLNLPSAFDPETPEEQGGYWKLPGSSAGSRRANARYGGYVMNTVFNDVYVGALPPSAILGPASKHLDTGGRQTFTVYRDSEDPTLLDEPLTFGVRRTKLSESIRWFKDGRFLGKGHTRMTIRRADQAGLYTLSRSTRKKRCWFVQIQVHLAACLRIESFIPVYVRNLDEVDESVPTCFPLPLVFGPSVTCVNGGVFNYVYQVCQCPPCFRGAFCERVAPSGDPFALMESEDFTCGELPGGNKKCEGYRFCLGGNYGCSCGCGWYGLDCDRPCRKGTFGADCLQKCNCLGNTCDRFTGECDSTLCPDGYHSFNCQLPIEIHLGNPGDGGPI